MRTGQSLKCARWTGKKNWAAHGMVCRKTYNSTAASLSIVNYGERLSVCTK